MEEEDDEENEEPDTVDDEISQEDAAQPNLIKFRFGEMNGQFYTQMILPISWMSIDFP